MNDDFAIRSGGCFLSGTPEIKVMIYANSDCLLSTYNYANVISCDQRNEKNEEMNGEGGELESELMNE